MPTSATKNQIKRETKLCTDYWLKTIKFKWFYAIYKQNHNNSENIESSCALCRQLQIFLALVQMKMLAFSLSQF